MWTAPIAHHESNLDSFSKGTGTGDEPNCHIIQDPGQLAHRCAQWYYYNSRSSEEEKHCRPADLATAFKINGKYSKFCPKLSVMPVGKKDFQYHVDG